MANFRMESLSQILTRLLVLLSRFFVSDLCNVHRKLHWLSLIMCVFYSIVSLTLCQTDNKILYT